MFDTLTALDRSQRQPYLRQVQRLNSRYILGKERKPPPSPSVSSPLPIRSKPCGAAQPSSPSLRSAHSSPFQHKETTQSPLPRQRARSIPSPTSPTSLKARRDMISRRPSSFFTLSLIIDLLLNNITLALVEGSAEGTCTCFGCMKV